LEVLDLEAIIPDGIRPLRRKEYHQLAELGAFEDEKIELLYGVLVPMSPVGGRHCWTIERLTELFVPKLVGRARVRIQMPVAASDESEPQPDLVVAPLGDAPFGADHPAHPLLVVEASESSLAKDRGLKARLYAECGVPEYWVVNLVERVIEVSTEPVSGRYQRTTVYRAGETLRPGAFPEIEVPVAEVVGPR
jgi:Uma2 family endonuclease